MPFAVEPLSADLPFGVTIRGLRRAQLDDPAVQERLRHHWIQDGLVVFRDGDNDQDFHVTLSKIFGPLSDHPVKEVMNKDNPELIDVIGNPDNAIIAEADGELGAAYLGWHKDLVYVERINHGGILRAIKPSSRGGITGFLDQIAAYDRLSDALKARIEGLAIVYRMGRWDEFPHGARAPIRLIKNSPQMESVYARLDRDFPPVAHPIVFVQPETGRKVLNVSPWFAHAIEGMENAEGDAILRAAIEHLIRPDLAYFHEWQPDDMVLWDNWRMTHSAKGVPTDDQRIMRRTTIAGDYALGRVEGAEEFPDELRIEV